MSGAMVKVGAGAMITPAPASVNSAEPVAVAAGTAVSVAPGTFVTNCHVTRHAAMVVLVRGGDRWRVEGERSDLYRDVCLLSVPALAQVPAIPLAVGAAPQVKQPLAAAGYTGGGGIHMRTGMVTAA